MDHAAFAHEWIAAWNTRDLEHVLPHYAADLVFTSPIAARVVPESGGTIQGLDAVAAYWRRALSLNPDLHFELLEALSTVDGCTVLYRNHRGQTVAETMLFNADGKVNIGAASYGDVRPTATA